MHNMKKREHKEKNEAENSEIFEMDKMKNFKFYFVQHNLENILKKMKRRRSPSRIKKRPTAHKI